MERVRLKKRDDPPERKRTEKNTMLFTDLGIERLKPPKQGQELYWDTSQRGLSLLVGARTKTFRSTFKLDGVWCHRTLGRFNEVVVEGDGENSKVRWAREQTRQDRARALKAEDPRLPPDTDAPKKALTYGEVVDKFIEHYAKPLQHTWDQTERVLKNNCRAFLSRPIDKIKPTEIRDLLRGFIADGHQRKAAITKTWLKKLWRWAYDEDHVPVPVIKGIDNVKTVKGARDRVYSDAEIKAIWKAADQLDDAEGAFAKLLLLLAPRKTALATIRSPDVDEAKTLWTTPHEATKSRKSSDKENVYLTPLPPLALDVLAAVPRREGVTRLFPDLPVHRTKGGRPTFYGVTLRHHLIERGAPKDFNFHAMRHTIATWLQNKGYSEWERGLVLNHASGATVTAGYSHGYPLDLKRELLKAWADHVAALVGIKRDAPTNVVPLRSA